MVFNSDLAELRCLLIKSDSPPVLIDPFSSVLGPTAVVVFSLVPLTIAAMLLYSFYFRPRADHPLRKHILLLQLLPAGKWYHHFDPDFLKLIKFE